jgi:hypothetical protein
LHDTCYSLHPSFKGTFSKSLGPRLFLIGASLPFHLIYAHAKNGFTPKSCMKLVEEEKVGGEERSCLVLPPCRIKGQISLIEIYKIIRPNLALISPINSLA